MENLNAASGEAIKFRSAKSRRTVLAIWLPSTLILFYLIWLVFGTHQGLGFYFIGFIYLIIYCMLAWMWFDTGYVIGGNVLAYRSGPMQGKIAVSSIRKIEKRKELFGGMKPALDSQGIIVHYNKFDDIYLSPEDQEGFIRELLKRNPGIEAGS